MKKLTKKILIASIPVAFVAGAVGGGLTMNSYYQKAFDKFIYETFPKMKKNKLEDETFRIPPSKYYSNFENDTLNI